MAAASLNLTVPNNPRRWYIGPTACLVWQVVSGGTADTLEMQGFTGAGADSAAAKHRLFGLTHSPMNDSAATAHIVINGTNNGWVELAVAGGVAADRTLMRAFTW